MSFSPSSSMHPGPGEDLPPLPPDYLVERPRRLRRTPAMRRLVRETSLSRDDFILPLFVVEGSNVRTEVTSMPGVFRESVDKIADTCIFLQHAHRPAAHVQCHQVAIQLIVCGVEEGLRFLVKCR